VTVEPDLEGEEPRQAWECSSAAARMQPHEYSQLQNERPGATKAWAPVIANARNAMKEPRMAILCICETQKTMPWVSPQARLSVLLSRPHSPSQDMDFTTERLPSGPVICNCEDPLQNLYVDLRANYALPLSQDGEADAGCCTSHGRDQDRP